MMEHQYDGIVRDIPSVMIGVKNDPFRTGRSNWTMDGLLPARAQPTASRPALEFRAVSASHLRICLARIEASPRESGDSVNHYERHQRGSSLRPVRGRCSG